MNKIFEVSEGWGRPKSGSGIVFGINSAALSANSVRVTCVEVCLESVLWFQI
jgi:hypothetical protein